MRMRKYSSGKVKFWDTWSLAPKEDWPEIEETEGEENEATPQEKKFITSPAQVNTDRKMQLQDAEVAKMYKV